MASTLCGTSHEKTLKQKTKLLKDSQLLKNGGSSKCDTSKLIPKVPAGDNLQRSTPTVGKAVLCEKAPSE